MSSALSTSRPTAPRRAAVVLLSACLSALLLPLSMAGTSVALPSMGAELHASLSSLQWAINGYNLAFGCLVLAAGSLADLVGRRRMFAIGTGLYAVGALVSALAGDILVLDIARTASGLGAAAALPSGSALLAQAFEGPSRARAFGAFGTTTGIGLALGPTVAGLLVGNFSWRAVFLVPAVIAFVVVALTPWIPESRNPAGGRVDKSGTFTFTGALLLLIYGLVEGPQAGWGSALVLGSFLAAAVLLVAFIAIERRQEHPMFDLSLLAQPQFLALCLTAVVVVFGFTPLLVALPTYFSAVDGLDAQQAGLTLIMLTGATLVFPVIAGFLTRWIPAKVQLVITIALMAIGAAWLTVIEPGSSHWTILGPLLCLGIATGISFGLLDGAAVSSVPAGRAGMAAGMFNTMRLAGEAASIAVISSLLVSFTRSGLGSGLGSFDSPYANDPGRVANLLNQGDMDTLVKSVPPGTARQGFAEVAGAAYTGALHTVLWILFAMFAVAVPVVALLLRERRKTATENGTGDPSPAAGPQGEQTQQPSGVG
ncbi:MFS transporter [Streptomyces sp. NPDC018019]|uniref:MFS transporter n=1 Tax=Streptomyces sp. NPDC018019 TaxID=3365030 RepID=UPI00378D11C6